MQVGPSEYLALGSRLLLPYLLAILGSAAVFLGIGFAIRNRFTALLSSWSPSREVSDGAATLLLLAGVAGVGWIAIVQSVAVLGFVVRIGIGMWTGLLGLAIASVGAWLLAPRLSRRKRLAVTALALLLAAAAFVIASAVAGHFYDVSWDGNETYQTAVMKLAAGYNPLTQSAESASPPGNGFWVDHYPKGTWIQAAATYSLTRRLERAKSAGWFLVTLCGFIWIALGLRLEPRRPALVAFIAVVVALNPIALTQAWTFMYDGQIASLLSIWVALALLIWVSAGRDSLSLAGLSATTLLLATSKYTALLYAIGLATVLIGALFLRNRRRVRVGRSIAVGRTAGVLGATMAISVFGLGYNPYVTNSLEHGNSFYPLFGAEKFVVMSNHMPGNWVGRGALYKLGMSILGRAADVGAYGPGTHAQLKVPFALYASELPPFLGPTTRVAGLGPWFGGCFLLALVLTVLLLARRTDRSSAPIITALFVVGVLLGTVIVMPETWWARYAPQLWLVPLLVGAAGVLWSSGAVRRWMGASVLALLLLNAMAVGAVNLAGQAYARERINQTFDSLGSSRHPVPIKQGDFMQSWVKFSERGIAYTIVPDSAKLAGGVAFPYLTVVAFPR